MVSQESIGTKKREVKANRRINRTTENVVIVAEEATVVKEEDAVVVVKMKAIVKQAKKESAHVVVVEAEEVKIETKTTKARDRLTKVVKLNTLSREQETNNKRLPLNNIRKLRNSPFIRLKQLQSPQLEISITSLEHSASNEQNASVYFTIIKN